MDICQISHFICEHLAGGHLSGEHLFGGHLSSGHLVRDPFFYCDVMDIPGANVGGILMDGTLPSDCVGSRIRGN